MSNKNNKKGKVIVNGRKVDIIPTKMSDFGRFSTPKLSEMTNNPSPRVVQARVSSIQASNEHDIKPSEKSEISEKVGIEKTPKQDGKVFYVRDLLRTLLKETFNTTAFGYEKWSETDPKTEKKWPPFGRDYFCNRVLAEGKKKPKTPIDSACCQNLHILFCHALSENMVYLPETISRNMKNIIQKLFSADFSYLVYFNDDSKEIKDKKLSYWLILIDKISNHFLGKETYKKEDLQILKTEETDFPAYFTEKTAGTYTHSLLPKEEKDTAKNKTKTDYSRSVVKDIKCLFFLTPTLVNIKNFIGVYLAHSKLSYHELPVVKVIGSPDNEINDSRYCAFRREKHTQYFYDIGEAAEYSQKGRLFYTYGNASEFQYVKPFIPRIKLIIVVPEKLTDMINDLAMKRFNDNDLDQEVISFHRNMSFLSHISHNDTYYLRCPDTSNMEFFRFAGFLDALIDPNRSQNKDEALFRKEYADVEKFLSSKYNGCPAFPHPIIDGR